MERANRRAIYRMFLAYLQWGNFAAADMARKILLIGLTRARRYTNYWGGREVRPGRQERLEKGTGDPAKAEPASIFFRGVAEGRSEDHPRQDDV